MQDIVHFPIKIRIAIRIYSLQILTTSIKKIDTKRSSTGIEKKTHTDMLPLSDFVSHEEHCWQKPAKTKYLRDTFTKSMQLVAISN